MGTCRISFEDVVEAMTTFLKSEGWVVVGEGLIKERAELSNPSPPRAVKDVMFEILAERVSWGLPGPDYNEERY